MSLHRRVAGFIQKNGVRLAIRAILRRFRSHPAAPVLDPRLRHPFDLRHGTDTSGFINNMVLNTPHGVVKTVYLAISPSTLKAALADLPVRCEDFTFLDIGCGKGRAILVAADFPFASLIGVELSPDLCHLARRNLATQTHLTRRATITEQDATTYTFPQAPLVLFFYDPFLEDIFHRFMANLETQLRASPREVYLLYAANSFASLMDRLPFLERVYDRQIPLSPEDAALDQLSYDLQFPPRLGEKPEDRKRITHEHFMLYRARI